MLLTPILEETMWKQRDERCRGRGVPAKWRSYSWLSGHRVTSENERDKAGLGGEAQEEAKGIFFPSPPIHSRLLSSRYIQTA